VKLLLAALLVACGGPDSDGSSVEPAPGDRNPALAALTPDLRSASLLQLRAEQEALQGRDDLLAVDRRRAVDLAWRNRSPAQVSDELIHVPLELRDQTLALRRAWRGEHLAFSWDSLDPDGQLEPRPQELSLSWLVLAWYLPLARNQRPFERAWVADFFERKAWYTPREGPLFLSYIDKVQMERVEKEILGLTPELLRRHAGSLPGPGMSEREAALEAALVERLLQGQSVLETEAP